MTAPVILFIFNRPAATRRLLDILRQIEPERLFVFADGPRNAADVEPCAAVRAAISTINWPCEVSRDYSETNLGTRRRIVSGISFALAQVDHAIILEDDCIPNPSFFSYCDDLLTRYQDDERVMMVSGTNALLSWPNEGYSYHFAYHHLSWGWATWSRAWRRYDDKLSAWTDPATHIRLREIFGRDDLYQARAHALQGAYAQDDTWDYGWTLACLLNNGLTITPAVNLITNIGFNSAATHTTNSRALGANLPSYDLPFPLVHPPLVEADSRFDSYLLRWLGGDIDPVVVTIHARHALAANQPLRARLLIDAFCNSRPDAASNPDLINLRAAATAAIIARR